MNKLNPNREVILECCGKPESQCRCDNPKPDEGWLLTDEEFVEWLSCQDSAKLYFLSEEECQREAQDAKTASIYEKKIRELKKKIHKTNVYYLREIQRLADEQALKSNKGGG